jgi:GNAT superfamily N-acetyltransferase
MKIDVVPFGDADEVAIGQAYEISRAASLHEVPDMPPFSAQTFISNIRRPAIGHSFERAVGYLDGRPAGYLCLGMPELDNLDNATVELYVTPSLRRRGAGRALFDFAVQRARALGRKRLTAETVQRIPDGDAFAAAMGASAALPEIRSRLDLPTADQDRLDAMLAESWTHADGYRFVKWDGVPPDEFIDDVAALDSRFFTDAPLGELDWEPEKVDADRVRQAEQRRLDCGFGRFHGGIEHIGSGRLVAWTTLAGAHDTPTHLWQNITIVGPPHRGHRLGMIVKLENLRHAREHRPELTAVDTFNASSNEHMLAINVAMGFRAVDSWMQWQQTV